MIRLPIVESFSKQKVMVDFATPEQIDELCGYSTDESSNDNESEYNDEYLPMEEIDEALDMSNRSQPKPQIHNQELIRHNSNKTNHL